jgi:hypothetical protein
MASEFKIGQMELSMKDIGKIIRLMVKENFSIQMETFTMECGRKIKLMEKEFISI